MNSMNSIQIPLDNNLSMINNVFYNNTNYNNYENIISKYENENKLLKDKFENKLKNKDEEIENLKSRIKFYEDEN